MPSSPVPLKWRQNCSADPCCGPAHEFCYRLPAVAYTAYNADMKPARSLVVSMRLPQESGKRLKRLANRHGWTASDACARLVEEGLRRSEFAFIDFRDSAVGRQAYIQGSTLAVWEVMLLVRSLRGKAKAAADHLAWPESKVRAAIHYAEAYPQEIEEALRENDTADFDSLKRMLPALQDFRLRAGVKRG